MKESLDIRGVSKFFENSNIAVLLDINSQYLSVVMNLGQNASDNVNFYHNAETTKIV